jgi:hypothetical protein
MSSPRQVCRESPSDEFALGEEGRVHDQTERKKYHGAVTFTKADAALH